MNDHTETHLKETYSLWQLWGRKRCKCVFLSCDSHNTVDTCSLFIVSCLLLACHFTVSSIMLMSQQKHFNSVIWVRLFYLFFCELSLFPLSFLQLPMCFVCFCRFTLSECFLLNYRFGPTFVVSYMKAGNTNLARNQLVFTIYAIYLFIKPKIWKLQWYVYY